MKNIKVLFVCMGNICRSPTAEAVFRHKVNGANMQEVVHFDSAGTHDYHIGKPPDKRTQHAALQRGYAMDDLRGRQVAVQDFEKFDHILAMDHDNLAILSRLCPPHHSHKLGLLLQHSVHFKQREEVPDPYYGGEQGFAEVLDMVEDATQGLLEKLRGSK